MAVRKMIVTLLLSLITFLTSSTESALHQHRDFQYNSLVDGRGIYNFAYDTGTSDAHTMHMEYRDVNGIVRGRYGYTDPWGKLRVVEYEAGPDGYKARGDVGPDLFPHSEAPGLGPPKPNPVPTPLRMSGWDPVRNPINRRVSEEEEAASYYPQRVDQPRYYLESDDVIGRYRSSVYSQNPNQDVEVFREQPRRYSKKVKVQTQNEPLTIYNIDVDPDEIRMAAPSSSYISQPKTQHSEESLPKVSYTNSASYISQPKTQQSEESLPKVSYTNSASYISQPKTQQSEESLPKVSYTNSASYISQPKTRYSEESLPKVSYTNSASYISQPKTRHTEESLPKVSYTNSASYISQPKTQQSEESLPKVSYTNSAYPTSASTSKETTHEHSTLTSVPSDGQPSENKYGQRVSKPRRVVYIPQTRYQPPSYYWN